MANRTALRVLSLPLSASRSAIKSRFRELAKLHHPDVAVAAASVNSGERMSQIAAAYSSLMEHDTPGRFTGSWGSRVAWSCESFALGELRADAIHDVYGVLISLDDEQAPSSSSSSSSSYAESASGGNADGRALAASLLRMRAHPMDSVLDLKRALQSTPDTLTWWGADRPIRADGLVEAWEIVLPRGAPDASPWASSSSSSSTTEENDSNCAKRRESDEYGGESTLLSNHFFLDDYGMHGGESVLLYAVVGRKPSD